ncbi:MAG: hypothetical protein ACRDZO_09650 [Egibacteraceae bacterium]
MGGARRVRPTSRRCFTAWGRAVGLPVVEICMTLGRLAGNEARVEGILAGN